MRTAKFISLLLGVMLLTGCWDLIGIEQRSLVSVLGVDYLPEAPHYLITIVYPIVDSARTQESLVQSVRATSLAEGYAILNHVSKGLVSFGKLLVTVFGEEAARQGVVGIVNDLYKHADIRTNSHIIVTKGLAVDLLSTVPPNEQRIGLYLRDLLHWPNQYGEIPAVPLYELASTMMIPGMEVLMTLVGPIGTIEPRPQGQRGEGSPSSNSNDNTQSNQGSAARENIQLLGATLWYGDKMVGEIDLSEAQYLSILKGTPRNMPMQILFNEDNLDFAPVADKLQVYIEQSSTKWQLTQENNVPYYKAKVNARVTLFNYQGLPNIMEKENAKLLEDLLATAFKANMLGVLQKVSAMGSDPLFLGQKFRLKYPQQWDPEKWYEMIKQAKFNVECAVTIRLTGYQIQRMQPKKGGPQ